MQYCRSCGKPLIEGAAFCGYCGASAEDRAEGAAYKAADVQSEPESIIPPVIQVTHNENNGGSPYPTTAPLPASIPEETHDEPHNLSSASLQSVDTKESVVETVQHASEAIVREMKSTEDTGSIQADSENDASRQQAESDNTKTQDKTTALQDTMAKDELWTWLKKDARRQVFFLEDQEPIVEELYMAQVEKRLEENNVPATIELRQIRWDLSDAREPMYLVKPETSAVNPLSCCLQFTHVGKYAFSEQKVFMAPPNLPETPGDPVDVPAPSSINTLTVIAIGLAGLFATTGGCSDSMLYGSYYPYHQSASPLQTIGALTMIVCFCLLMSTLQKQTAINEAMEHNKKVAEQVEAWEKAWSDWETSVFIHSFQETTHGQVSRIFEAVFDCIRQVNEELFQTESSVDEREDTNMSTIEAQIARRKESYR